MNKIEFKSLLEKQVIVLDGAMGTMIQNLNLDVSAYGGETFKMLSDLLVFSRPEEVKKIHLAYYRAGANGVETNTFGASPLRLEEFDFSKLDLSDFPAQTDGADLRVMELNEFCYRMNKQAAEIACNARDEYKQESGTDRPLLVFGSIGPSNWVLTSTEANLKQGDFDQIVDNFYQQTCGLIDGGADVLLFETQQDMLEVKAAVFGAQKALKEKEVELPIMAQVTVDQYSKMQIFHTDILAALTTLQCIGIDAFGINCSIGPELMTPTISKLSQYSQIPISVVPNAGLPVSENGQTVFKLTPQEMANYIKGFVEEQGVNIVGGCCGTTPGHIEEIAKTVQGVTPKKRNPEKATFISGPQNAVEINSDEGLIRIGERLNVRGSKKVRVAVENESGVIDKDALEEVVREQADDLGLDILDVCMDSNQVSTKDTLVRVIQDQTVDFKGAMSLDSFDVSALAEAIKVYPGRPIINSISLEEYSPNVDKIDAVLEVTKCHAPLYVCLTTDQQGPATTADRKVELAEKIIDKVVHKHGQKHDQLLIDINAFPIGSESEEGMNFALESLNAIERIKAIHPDVRTVIGVGNLTNGLASKPYIRKVLTSVFLDEGRKRGFDGAIINPNHYVPVENLPPEDYQLGLDIILKHDMDAFEKLEEIAENKKGDSTVKRRSFDDLPPVDAVCEKIKLGFKAKKEGSVSVEGRGYPYKDSIVEEIAEIIKEIKPLDLINDHLMVAMSELGDGFASGKVSLPHLLKSADVMKQVMGFLEAYMKDATGEDSVPAAKGTIVLGTVYQDVHSIGKDLTRTLLENYGYKVIDLGVQVPLPEFIAQAKEHKADAIGLSALLVQTSNHMITIAEMLAQEGMDDIDLLIGGAPVSNRHAAYVAMAGKDDLEKIKHNVFYCASAMDGVNVMNALSSIERKGDFIAKNTEKLKRNYLKATDKAAEEAALFEKLPKRKPSFPLDQHQPSEPGTIHHLKTPLCEFKFQLNQKNLFSLNWKYGGKSHWAEKGIKEDDLLNQLNEMSDLADKEGWVSPQGAFAIFPCYSEGNQVHVVDPEDQESILGTFSFNDFIGKDKKDIANISQYFRGKGAGDYIGIQISTAGLKVEDKIQALREESPSETLLWQGLADRVAEDMAENIHQLMVEDMKLKGTNSGARYSPGYPAMIELSNNKVIVDLLNAEEHLSLKITEADEFQPTGTTAAVVCFHPDASYG